ncbi:MAG: ATP-binding cassette domain-containing protein [Bacteroidota bacterium]|jgi:ABC-type multidrug transport system ATPase subunit
MKICLNNISKRYQQNWIFKDLTLEIQDGSSLAILGNNGSGKSSLLRIIASMQSATKGTITYTHQETQIEPIAIYNMLSYAAVGMQLIEEFTLSELLTFHFSFKKSINQLRVEEIISILDMKNVQSKLVGDFSSGMKQRVKLAQAIFTDAPLLLLDEPCSNLDKHGIAQYQEWIATYQNNRTIIVASNDVNEYSFCKQQIVLA